MSERGGAGGVMPRVLIDQELAAEVTRHDRSRPRGVELFDVQRLNGTQAAVFLGPASAIVLKAKVARDAELLVRHVRRASPHICILLVSASARLALHRRLRHLSLAGLDDLFELDFAGEDVRLLEAIRRHGVVRLPHLVPPLNGATDERTHAVVAFCLRSGDRRLSAEQVADWFGEHRRNLNRWVQPVTGRTVSQTPAEAVGLDDRGAIVEGRRADLLRVSVIEGQPVVRAVWREGRRIA